jgi:hypothetical protein
MVCINNVLRYTISRSINCVSITSFIQIEMTPLFSVAAADDNYFLQIIKRL